MVQRLGQSWGLKKEAPKAAANGASYPADRYHAEHGERRVRSAAEAQALGAGWSNKPGGVVAPEPEPEPEPAPVSVEPEPPAEPPEEAKARPAKKPGGRR